MKFKYTNPSVVYIYLFCFMKSCFEEETLTSVARIM